MFVKISKDPANCVRMRVRDFLFFIFIKYSSTIRAHYYKSIHQIGLARDWSPLILMERETPY